MHQGEPARVFVHQGETGAGHPRVLGHLQTLGQAVDKLRFAAPQFSCKRQDVAWSQPLP